MTTRRKAVSASARTHAVARRYQTLERQRRAAWACEQFNCRHYVGIKVTVTAGDGKVRSRTRSKAGFIESGGRFVPAVLVEGFDDWVALDRVEVTRNV